jgi:hypothetical protein
MSYYYADEQEDAPNKLESATEQARKVLSKEGYKQIADINKESIAGGLGLGVAGYVWAKSKDKNVWVYTILGGVAGFVLFNMIFRKGLKEKLEKITEKKKEVLEPKKEEAPTLKKKVRRKIRRRPNIQNHKKAFVKQGMNLNEVKIIR